MEGTGPKPPDPPAGEPPPGGEPSVNSEPGGGSAGAATVADQQTSAAVSFANVVGGEFAGIQKKLTIHLVRDENAKASFKCSPGEISTLVFKTLKIPKDNVITFEQRRMNEIDVHTIGIDPEKYKVAMQIKIKDGLYTMPMRAMRRPTKVSVDWVGYLTPDSCFLKLMSYFGEVVDGKVYHHLHLENKPLNKCSEDEKFIKGKPNGNKWAWVYLDRDLPSYGLMEPEDSTKDDPWRVRIHYQRQPETCARCHQGRRGCRGKANAKKCRDKKGPKIDFEDYWRVLIAAPIQQRTGDEVNLTANKLRLEGFTKKDVTEGKEEVMKLLATFIHRDIADDEIVWNEKRRSVIIKDVTPAEINKAVEKVGGTRHQGRTIFVVPMLDPSGRRVLSRDPEAQDNAHVEGETASQTASGHESEEEGDGMEVDVDSQSGDESGSGEGSKSESEGSEAPPDQLGGAGNLLFSTLRGEKKKKRKEDRKKKEAEDKDPAKALDKRNRRKELRKAAEEELAKKAAAEKQEELEEAEKLKREKEAWEEARKRREEENNFTSPKHKGFKNNNKNGKNNKAGLVSANDSGIKSTLSSSQSTSQSVSPSPSASGLSPTPSDDGSNPETLGDSIAVNLEKRLAAAMGPLVTPTPPPSRQIPDTPMPGQDQKEESEASSDQEVSLTDEEASMDAMVESYQVNTAQKSKKSKRSASASPRTPPSPTASGVKTRKMKAARKESQSQPPPVQKF